VGAQILVVDDNLDNVELVEYLLTAAGHEPILATSGRRGIEMAVGELPDLVLMDIAMPGMDGFEAAEKIRQQLGEVRIVAVTASAMVGDKERILDAGFDGYISKPISPADFVGQVEMFLSDADRPSSRSGR
jgi:two-component system, cell cycle response regulator DivK